MFEAIVGAIIAGVLVFRQAESDCVLRFWVRVLFIAAAIYVVFALVGNAPGQWFLIEAGGLVLFSVLAMLGLRFSPWILAFAWFAHIAWDNLLHSANTAFVPPWYPPLCIGFDLVVGVYIVFFALGRVRNTAAGVNRVR